MMSALDELGDMIRKQQQLRDKTFKQGQDSQARDRQRGQPGDQNQRTRTRIRSAICARTRKACATDSTKPMDQLRKHGLGNPGQEEQGEGKSEMG